MNYYFINDFAVSVKIGDTFKTSSKFNEMTNEIVTITSVTCTGNEIIRVEGTAKTIHVKKADRQEE